MAKRRFELVEGASSKFWEIDVNGKAFTVTYGRIGTAGVSKTTECANPADAEAQAEKLVREKTKKGYAAPGAAEATFRPPEHIGTQEHFERFLNYKVTGFDPEADGEGGDEGELRSFPKLRDLDKRAFRVGIDYDDASSDFDARLTALLEDEKIGQLRALVLGQWFEAGEDDAPGFVAQLAAAGPKLKSLKGIFAGDIVQEENEISWIHQTDYAPLLHALPDLEELVVRGGNGLRFQGLKHAKLKSLTVQTGGLSKQAIGDILAAKLPELRELVLWLGVDEYGGDHEVADLAPLLAGTLFPKLEHLGLQNSDRQDEIAKAVAEAPIVGRLKGLDLSMGTLSDEGGEALATSKAIKGLKHLNLRRHYLSPAMAKRIKALGIDVDLSDRQEAEDEDDRYAEVTE
jgi:predicted DNA-binding WGR domain protein